MRKVIFFIVMTSLSNITTVYNTPCLHSAHKDRSGNSEIEAMLSLFHINALAKKMNTTCSSLYKVCNRIRNDNIEELDNLTLKSELREMIKWMNAYQIGHCNKAGEEALLCDLILSFFHKCIDLEVKKSASKTSNHTFSTMIVNLLDENAVIDNTILT